MSHSGLTAMDIPAWHATSHQDTLYKMKRSWTNAFFNIINIVCYLPDCGRDLYVTGLPIERTNWIVNWLMSSKGSTNLNATWVFARVHVRFVDGFCRNDVDVHLRRRPRWTSFGLKAFSVSVVAKWTIRESICAANRRKTTRKDEHESLKAKSRQQRK